MDGEKEGGKTEKFIVFWQENILVRKVPGCLKKVMN